jgi:hypothetical protein
VGPNPIACPMVPMRDFDSAKYSQDQLTRMRRFTIPMRWLITQYMRRPDPAAHQYIEVQELDLPEGWELCGSYLTPGGMGIQCIVYHPSFPPAPMEAWEIPSIDMPVRIRSLELVAPRDFLFSERELHVSRLKVEHATDVEPPIVRGNADADGR